jgi:hypothetical protein
MDRKYEIVITFILPNQQEIYVLWDVELFFNMVDKDTFKEFLLDGEKTGIGINPISVSCDLYLNPQIQTLETPMGEEMILMGKKIFHVISF